MQVIENIDSINFYVRQGNTLYPGDSVHRAVEMLRGTTDTLPILDSQKRLRGVISLSDLLPLLGRMETPSDDVNDVLLEPVGHWVREPGGVGRADMSLADAHAEMERSGETTLFILDEEDRYLGYLSLVDLLVPNSTPPRPAGIGGMATPWGVYLTTGSIQGGASNWALLGSGVMLGLLMSTSYVLIGGGTWLLQKGLGWPLYSLWMANPPAQISFANLGWFALQAITLPLFLLLMRALPLAGYHAAEHQVVHAMERGEPLHPEIVKRMPRVHPRCGTNLMAGALVFTFITQLLPALHIGFGSVDSAVLGGITALFTWRSVGSFLQQYFTTKPATDKQIAAGIAAAQDVERKYLTTPLRNPTIFRRFWCMGMPQMIIGSSPTGIAVLYLFDFLFRQLK